MAVPTDALHWSLALAPLVVLLVLLVWRRWGAPEAGPIGLLIAAGVAYWAFQAPVEAIAVAGAKGIWDAIFVLYVIWASLLLYHIVDAAGGFHALRTGIMRFSENRLFLVLAFGWVFASFMQGISGFGVPIAVVAPLLVGLGVRPVYAVVIPLVGHAWANLFGTLAVAWLAMERVSDVGADTAWQAAVLLWIPNLLGGLTIAWIFGRWKAVLHALPVVLIVSLVHGGGQLAVALWNPVLAGFFATTAALLLLYPLSRWRRYRERSGLDADEAMKGGGSKDSEREPIMSLPMAILPYGILVAAALVLAIPAAEEFLGQVEVGPPMPAVETGYGIVTEEQPSYSPFAPFTHPGLFLLVAAAAAYLLFRSKGYYARWEDENPFGRELLKNGFPASVAVAALLVMSKIMDDTGQTDALALGIAAVSPPLVYAFAANFIGALGSFMTSSNTASNILFAPVQGETAGQLEVSRSAVLAAQGAGGAIGNSISPANVVLGTGTAGIAGQEGTVLRLVLPWAGIAAVLVGAGTVFLATMGT